MQKTRTPKTALLLGFSSLALLACGASRPRPAHPTSESVVDMEEMHITAGEDAAGAIAFEATDAEQLFRQGIARVRAGDCAGAVLRYDRVATEFQGSRYVSPALYNAGLCLTGEGELAAAAGQYERLLRDLPRSPDVRDASFQLAALDIRLERWDDGIRLATELLARTDLTPDTRLEAMARMSQALLGAGRVEDAATQADGALRYFRTRSPESPVRDDYFVAATNYVLAETLRLRSEAIEIPVGTVPEVRPVLERRAQLLLRAQRAYFDTIGRTDPEWASAAGYRIGSMYDTFWHALTEASVPPPPRPLEGEDLEFYRARYRAELGELVRPLLRHAIRYWELTLLMVERTGAQSEWTARIRADLDQMRERLGLLESAETPPQTPPAPAEEAADTDPSSPPSPQP
jgi:tetratricopeptide (TPR) repeat protein